MKILKTISVLSIVIALVSCSSVKVVVDSNDNADFSIFHTYSFQSWQDVSDEIFGKADKKLLRDSFIKEFERRGMERVSSNGDMQVSLYLVTSTETAYSGYNDYVGGRNSTYSHYRGSWGYGYAGNTSKQQGKLVGTLIMNVYDENGKNQIWQAIATSTVQENYEKRDKTIPAKVASIMRNFPVRPK